MALQEYLADKIKQNGPMSVAEYMAYCLYHPDWGYYRHNDPLGKCGDFITSPEISQMFGEIIGFWHMDLWQKMGRPDQISILELGPGRGTLMQDMLRVCSSEFKKAVSLHLVDINDAMKREQMKRLEEYSPLQHESIEDALSHMHGGPLFVIANEFFDALPIHQFDGDGKERQVEFVDSNFKFTFPTNQVVHEYSPMMMEIAYYISAAIDVFGGSALFIDYGYVNGEGDSLQAIYDHKYTDVFQHPGNSDLTAHVDFASLAKSLEDIVTIHGPVTQGDFLTELGIGALNFKYQAKSSPAQAAEFESALHRLVNPGEMGQLFKVMAITSAGMPTPEGFSKCLELNP